MAMARLTVLLIAACAAQLAAGVQIVRGPVQTSIARDGSVDPAGELDLSDPRLARKVTGCQPEGLHITQWTANSMLVSWQTCDFKNVPTGSPAPAGYPLDPKSVDAYVRWGTRPGNYKWRAKGSDSTVYSQVYNGAGGGYTYYSPILHHVLIGDLRPSTTYFYIVGNDKDGWSQEMSFTTARRGFPLRVGFIGDLGETANSSDTLDHLAYNNPDVIVLTGDFVYADNHASNNSAGPASSGQCGGQPCTYQPRWDAWARFTERLFATVPFVSCKGNHEIEPQTTVPGGPSFASANARFPYPQDADLAIRTAPMNREDYLDSSSTPPYRAFKNEDTFQPISSYYSVDYPGVAHIVNLNNYIGFGPTSKQYQWFVQDMQSVDRRRTPWLIVVFHVPPYHSYNTHFKESDTFLSVYESLFVDFNVDLVMNGHVHAYERTYPVEFYQKVQDGPMYITIGDGGNIEGLYKSFMDDKTGRSASTQKFCDLPVAPTGPNFNLPGYQPTPGARTVISLQDGYFCPSTQPEWSAFRQPSFGHGILDIYSPTVARWRWHRNNQGYAEIADEVVIKRNAGWGNGEGWGGDRRNLRKAA